MERSRRSIEGTKSQQPGHVQQSLAFRSASGPEFFFALNYAKHMDERVARDVELRDYADTQCFLTEDQNTGFAVTNDGELRSVFNIGAKGRGRLAVEHAIRNGVVSLECLPTMAGYYETFGFTLHYMCMIL